MDYNQLLPVVPYRKQMKDENRNDHYVNMTSLDYFPWCSRLVRHLNVIRMTSKARPHGDPVFGDLLNTIDTRRFTTDSHIPLMSISSQLSAYQWLWRWYTTARKESVRVDCLVLRYKTHWWLSTVTMLYRRCLEIQ